MAVGLGTGEHLENAAASRFASLRDVGRASAPAQTGNVGGVIIDDRSQQPIKGVQVYVLNQSATAETDAAGRFLLSVARGRQTIAASMIGSGRA